MLISIIITGLYVILILIFTVGWNRIPEFHPTDFFEHPTQVTVVVACRNEEKNLIKLLEALQNQTYKEFELIIVNDHSTDATSSVLKSAVGSFADLKIIESTGYGKKQAIKEGILHAKSGFIITTDADCIPVNTWIATICSYQLHHPSDLIICPVCIRPVKTLFEKMQQIEFATLVGTGAGSAGAGMPVMCNAANMAFTKKAWYKSQPEMHEEEVSGDDMFLLQSIKKRNGVIRYLQSNKAIVYTQGSKTILQFIQQRARWTSKSSAYTDWQLILTAVLVFLTSFSLVLLYIGSLFSVVYSITLAIVFSIKLLIDGVFISKIRKSLNPDFSLPAYLLMSLIYPFYILTIVIYTLLKKNSLKWK